ncbi:Long-chain-fatty-acid--CoA ligase [Richelia intracellularis]|nr:Long-chain-fatty-acid--CoA ligase [Richelia intracellularis]
MKDPLFFADSFFVDNFERIETMLFLMSLCLLVYHIGQKQERKTLKIIKTGIRKKLDKLTMTSTLRFVFQSFQGIHIFTFDGVNQIVNLTSSRHFMLIFLPSFCLKSYLLS